MKILPRVDIDKIANQMIIGVPDLSSNGLFLGSDDLTQASADNPTELGRLVHLALERSLLKDRVVFDVAKKYDASLASAFGFKNVDQLRKHQDNVCVIRNATTFDVHPSWNAGPRKGLCPIKDAKITLDAPDANELGLAIISAFKIIDEYKRMQRA